MLIVDSQVHIWGADIPQRPWPKRAEAQRPVPLGKDDLLREMDEAGVDRVVIVPPSWEISVKKPIRQRVRCVIDTRRSCGR